MATFIETCSKYAKKRTHPAHSWTRTHRTVRGKVIDTYKCPGIKAFGR